MLDGGCALDSEVEAAIQESLETVMAEKTVFAIAHRSTISHMDRIVVMDEGKIIEEGHITLLKNKVFMLIFRATIWWFSGCRRGCANFIFIIGFMPITVNSEREALGIER